jgi:2-dehydro-3-deoxy-L-rhamnonate dehydrogenase (NAD+)
MTTDDSGSSTPSAFGGLDVSGHNIIVLGAGSGIGRAAALLLLARGAQVIAADFDEVALSALPEAAAGLAGAVRCMTVDITREADLSELLRPFGSGTQLHALVNSVGITGVNGVPGHEIPLEDFVKVLNVNLVAAFSVSRLAIPLMLPHEYGRVLHVASIAGKEGNPNMVSYSASKAGLIGMVKSLAKDYATRGITVNALAPAVIRTPLVDRMPVHQVELNVSKIPMGRLGTLTEAAEAIAWAVSPAAGFTTGFTFDLSGGRATY